MPTNCRNKTAENARNCLKVARNWFKHEHKVPSMRKMINETHVHEIAGRYASEVSGDNLRAPGTSGTSRPDLCVNLRSLDRMGTNGTSPRDTWDMSTGWLQSKCGVAPPSLFVCVVFILRQNRGYNVLGGPEL